MKYIILIGDGMADNPAPEYGGKTALESAEKPLIDQLARQGEQGSVRTVPQGVAPGSDTAILSIFGYDPRQFYSGRSPLEAAGAGVALQVGDVSYRCNMIALEDSPLPFARKKILSHNGGSVDGDTALELMEALLKDPRFAKLAREQGMSFYPSPSFRHIAVQRGANIQGLQAAPPHDHLGEAQANYLPRGAGVAQGLCEMMELAHEILDAHPLNEARRGAGKLPANGLWFWAEGQAIQLPALGKRYGKRGLVVSAVPLARGIGVLAGMDAPEVPGATGELDTNYEGKTQAVLDALLKHGYNFAVLHVEAPDECTHNGDIQGKLQAIHWLDSRTLKPLLAGLSAAEEAYRILILSDHKTLTTTRGHDGDPVPYILYDSRETKKKSGLPYSEANGSQGPYIEEGHRLLEHLFAN